MRSQSVVWIGQMIVLLLILAACAIGASYLRLD